MKDRILQIMRSKNMSQNEFASAIKMSPASLSSIINGHNNPTTKYVFAIHDRFPEININWLMFGEGEMMEGASGAQIEATTEPGRQQQQQVQTDIFASSLLDTQITQTPPDMGKPLPYATQQTSPVHGMHSNKMDVKNQDKPQRRIKEIRIFFDDNTFEVFKGNTP